MAQAECITTAIRELMSRATLPNPTAPVRAAHRELASALAENPPHPIYVDADSEDIDARADHVAQVLAAVDVYLTAILSDTAANIPAGVLDRKYLAGLYSDFTHEAVGGIRNGAEELAEYEAWRAS